MKILHLSSSDILGGAARAAWRLHQGFLKLGMNSTMLVQNKASDDETVVCFNKKIQKGIAKIKPTLDCFPLEIFSQHKKSVGEIFSLQWVPDNISTKVSSIAPDIINLHWVNSGFLQIETLAKFGLPIVLTLHDMWPFTGGCHYSQGCDRYTQSCGKCPQLKSTQECDLSRWVWKRKEKAWKDLNLTIVTPSKWLAECAQSSSLFGDLPVQVIPSGLDTQKYRQVDKQIARSLLGLPTDKKIILFGAINSTTDRRKGYHLLIPALQKIKTLVDNQDIELVVFGASQPSNTSDLSFKTHCLGRLNDDISLALAYSAADVMTVPSIQEAFGQTASESLACGTPVVAFDATGLKDIVDHQQNGYLVNPFDTEDLAYGILWTVENEERQKKLSENARLKAEAEFDLMNQAKTYLKLYIRILDNKPNLTLKI
ncbi:MAG: glycosyltransferase [Chloroflexaceae bacterium]|nr:glycosyltransferase [Chloroflexaceae bacterium]